MSIGNIWFCKATILCSMFIFMLYCVCDISKKKHKCSTAVLFEYLKWLNFCSVNKKERELRTNCAIVFCYIVVLLLYPVLTIKQSCSPWIAHKDVEIYWTDIYMFLFHIKCDFERKRITEHSILCRPPFMILFFSMFDNGKIDVSDCYGKFVLLYIWPLKCIIFKTFLWNITGKGVTGTIFELELTYDALVHVFWEVTETLGHYFTRKHLFSG